jgi:hypothetical protein
MMKKKTNILQAMEFKICLNLSASILCVFFLFCVTNIKAGETTVTRGSILVEYWRELSASSIADLKKTLSSLINQMNPIC